MHDDQAVQSFQTIKPATRPLVTKDIPSFSLIWSRGINRDNETNVLQNTLNMDGIISARYTCKAPYILLIKYDPGITNQARIEQIYCNTLGFDAIDFILRQ